jgi:hypothetical protein
MRTFLLLLFFAFGAVIYGQSTAQEPDVDWAAYIELILPADPLLSSGDEDPKAGMAVLKLTSRDAGFSETVNHSLNYKLWEMARQNEWEIFEDAGLTRPLSFETAMRRATRPDTIISFDPSTYEEKLLIAIGSRELPYEAEHLKVRQLLRYHNATANFDIQTLAIAPCWDDGSAPYWLKVPDDDGLPGNPLTDTTITWITRYKTFEASPGPENWEEIKNTTGPILDRFIDRIRNDSSIVLYQPEGPAVSITERPCLFSCSQSMMVFDPQTNKEEIQEINVGLDHEMITELQLVETWFWNEEELTLVTRLDAVAPRYWVTNTGDDPTYARVLFYRRCE